jgi:tetratricopeptide (TPR) repeat protein
MVKPRAVEPLPTEQGGWLKLLTRWNAYPEIIAKFVENIAKLIGYPIAILLVVAVVKNIGDRKAQISLDPVTVPKIIEDEGYTGLEAANVVAANISQIHQETKTIARKHKFNSVEPKLDITLPQSGISLTSAVAFLAESLGFGQRHVHAELMVASGTNWQDNAPINVVISVQLTGAESDSSSTRVNVKTPDQAFRWTAIEVLKVAEPDVLSIYENDDEHDTDAALQLIQRARDEHPRDPDVYVGWGWILSSKKDFDEAIKKYRQALDFNKKYYYAHGYWANTLLQKGDFDGAIEQSNQALAINRKYADAHDYLGNAYQAKQKYAEAINEYREAVREDPESEYAYGDWGNALRGEQKYGDAIEEYQKELWHHPKNAVAYGNWAYVLLLTQDYDGAIAEYEEAIALEPPAEAADAYSNWGCALQGKRQYDGAIEKYEHALALDPNYVDAYSNWGNALQRKGDYEGAIALYKAALAFDLKSAAVYSNWGDAPLLVAFECSSGC